MVEYPILEARLHERKHKLEYFFLIIFCYEGKFLSNVLNILANSKACIFLLFCCLDLAELPVVYIFEENIVVI